MLTRPPLCVPLVLSPQLVAAFRSLQSPSARLQQVQFQQIAGVFSWAFARISLPRLQVAVGISSAASACACGAAVVRLAVPLYW
jgi:hypothetical protein